MPADQPETPKKPERWEIEFTDEYGQWWDGLSVEEQTSIAGSVLLLMEKGPALGRPHADTLAKQSKHPNLKELRITHRGDAYRVLFAFDPRRVAILLMGGRKPDQKWYKRAIAEADKLYDEHLELLRREKLIS